jgi:hypothetical protein
MMVLFEIFVFVVALAGIGLGALELYYRQQRELATLQSRSSDHRMESLEHKIDGLTQLVYQQTIALDGVPRLPADERLEERIRV